MIAHKKGGVESLFVKKYRIKKKKKNMWDFNKNLAY